MLGSTLSVAGESSLWFVSVKYEPYLWT